MMRKRPTFAATAADLGALRSFDVKERNTNVESYRNSDMSWSDRNQSTVD